MASIGIDIGGTRVKSALVHDGVTVATASSTAPYSRPDRATLLDSIHDAFILLTLLPITHLLCLFFQAELLLVLDLLHLIPVDLITLGDSEKR